MTQISRSDHPAVPERMSAVRVHHFGGLEAMQLEQLPPHEPRAGEVLIRVYAAGVGPWDALVRSGQSGLLQTLPLTLGADLSGVIQVLGAGVTQFKRGDEVFGVTNAQFIGAYAEYAIADVTMIARKPSQLSHLEAASVPVVTITAQQLLFDHGHVNALSRVLVHGAAGNVGAYAVQLAKRVGAEVIATAFTRDLEYVRSLGADTVIDSRTTAFEDAVADIDVVIDTVGGQVQSRSLEVLKAGGLLISSVSLPDQVAGASHRVQGTFFIVKVTTAGLTEMAGLLEANQLLTDVGEVLPLSEARLAHEMLAGKAHQRGKIVLAVHA